MRPGGLRGPTPLGDDAVWFAWRRLFVFVPTHIGAVRSAGSAFAGYQQALGERVVFVVLIKGVAERPGDDFQAMHEAHLEAHEEVLAGHAFIVRAEGFVASFFISVASRVMMATRRREVPQSLHTDFAAAGSWIARHVGGDAKEIAQVLAFIEGA